MLTIQQAERNIAHAYRTGNVSAYDRAVKALCAAQYRAKLEAETVEPIKVQPAKADRLIIGVIAGLTVGIIGGIVAAAVWSALSVDIVPVYLEADRAALTALIERSI